jgi:RimJ/RimL family protein N-acetyltransferase
MSLRKGPHYFWAISVLRDKLGHIGNITAYIDEANKIADLGILIGETKAWGKGYAAEAWMAVCEYLFKKMNIHKITAGTMSSNERMLNLMKRVGMHDDGRRIKQYIWEGKEVDAIYKAIFKKRSEQKYG